MSTEFNVFSAEQLINSIRSGPYKNTINSVSELIDNSIQANASYVQLICIDGKAVSEKGRRTKRISKIAVYDNGIGMDPLMLRKALQFGESPRDSDGNGIGKFGMGLPNSSFSRSRSVTVWSWQKGKTYKIRLNLDQIKAGQLTVPEAIEEEIPNKYTKHILGKDIEESGTFVLWDDLDLVKEKKSKNLLENHEFLLGRKYRYQVHDGEVRIHLTAIEQSDNNINWNTTFDQDVRANDPLYLMKNTSTPASPDPYSLRTLFQMWGAPHIIKVEWRGKPYEIKLTFSIVDPDIRRKLGEKINAGDTAQGAHAKRNAGISIVRAKRELEPDMSFHSTYDTTDRWWGIEVSFPPGLDEVFGVDFYKQSANQFTNLDLEDEAKSEGMSYEEYRKELEENHDSRIIIHEISSRIRSNLSTIKKQLKAQTENSRNRKKVESGESDKATDAGTKDTRKRIDEGHAGTSDMQESEDENVRKEKLTNYLEQATGDRGSAKGHAEFLINNKLKFDFQSQTLGGFSFFSCESVAGVLNININASHPLHDHLWKILDNDENNESLIALKILLQAWSRLEDEAPDQRKEDFADLREDWGRLIRDQLRMAFDN